MEDKAPNDTMIPMNGLDKSPDNSDLEMKDLDLQGLSMTNRKKSLIIKRDDSYIKPTKVEVVTKSLAKYLIPIMICLSAIVGLVVNTAMVMKNGIVSTDSPTCSGVGVRILQKGGNAVDAAISTGLCLGVISPYASGIGGGGYMMIHMANTNKQDFIDYREEAPGAATHDMFAGRRTNSTRGGLSIAVPGEIKGYHEAWKLYGNLTWAELFEEPIKLARDGFACSRLLSIRLNQLGDVLFQSTGLKSVFAPNGVVPVEGTLIKRTALANTLETIANNGPDGLYKGQVAADLASDIQAEYGIITTNDLANYQAKRRAPLTSFYRGYTIVGGPPPSSGVIVNFMLNLLEKFDLERLSSRHVLSYHYIIEALKHGFAHRTYLGDISFANITNYVNKLNSKSYASYVNQKFSSSKTFPPEYYLIDGKLANEGAGTSHISIMDKDRNAVAATHSVNLNFGSKILSQKTGIVLNNHMDDFSTQINETNIFGLRQSEINKIEPGKRPLSSMCPLLIFDGPNVYMAIGSSGGPTIISSLLQVFLNIHDFHKEVKKSVDDPRMHSQLYPWEVKVEPGIPTIIIDTLKEMGHNISRITSVADGQFGVGNVQVVVNQGEFIYGAADDRKLGAPNGY